VLRVTLVGAALALCGYGLVTQWDQTRHALSTMSWPAAFGSLVPGTAALVAWMLGWRVFLAGLGSPLPVRAAARVTFIAGLGKYVPGKVWSLVAQMELGRTHGVPRLRSFYAMALGIGTSIASGLAVAAATLPLTSPAATARFWWAFPLAPLLLIALHPRIVTVCLNVALRLVRRPPLERPVSMATMLGALGFSLLGWALFGAHTWLLAVAAGGSGRTSPILATGAFALAFAVGFLVFVAPGGIGAREAALVVTLGPVLPPGAPLVVAVVSRVVLTLADLLLAGVAVLLGGRPRGLAAATSAADAETDAVDTDTDTDTDTDMVAGEPDRDADPDAAGPDQSDCDATASNVST
jgi:glycosyltransferase 2 family protein